VSAETTWPEGVIARYVTVGGATVDIEIEDADPNRRMYVARCQGCNGHQWNDVDYEGEARDWAQSHAEACRAMPKPGGAR
jgi:hypothetical protein